MGEIHKAAFRNLGLTFSEEDMRAYNQYILQMRPEVSYSSGEIREITRLYQVVGSQLSDLHPGIFPDLRRGWKIDFRLFPSFDLNICMDTKPGVESAA